MLMQIHHSCDIDILIQHGVIAGASVVLISVAIRD